MAAISRAVCQLACSKISTNLRTILPIRLSKLLIKVVLFAKDNSVVHHNKERHEADDSPPSIGYQGQAKIKQRHAEIKRLRVKRNGPVVTIGAPVVRESHSGWVLRAPPQQGGRRDRGATARTDWEPASAGRSGRGKTPQDLADIVTGEGAEEFGFGGNGGAGHG